MNRSDRKNKGNSDGIEIPVTDVEETVSLTPEEEPAHKGSVTIPLEEYEALVEEAARSREQYLLAVADFENFRKRVEKEKEDIVCFANERLIHELLPILDNLQRALSTVLDQAGADSILEGVRMVSTQLHSVLGACGLEPLEAVGVLPSDEHVDGTVISELQKGYRLKGKILRPSMVHVAGQPSGTRDNEGEN